MGSPPPAALKKLVPKCLSANIMVTAPASTGIIAISKNAVISQVQTNIGIFMNVMPLARKFKIVAIILIDPIMDESPIMCIAKIIKSVLGGAYCVDNGAYMVQPKLGPPPLWNKVEINSVNAKGSSQKLQLFKRGRAISGAPIINGICQLAIPVNAGMTTPKSIIRPCIVVI